MTNKPEMALVMARAMFGFDEDDESARSAAVLVVRKGLAAVCTFRSPPLFTIEHQLGAASTLPTICLACQVLPAHLLAINR
jgi:hypothetical protein